MSPAARLDPLQIWNYLAETSSLSVADKVLADIRTGIRKIASSPSLGHRRDDLTDLPLRFFRVHKYLIVYDARTNPTKVARVLHGARDLSREFRSAEPPTTSDSDRGKVD
jgi:plasmid stabilization system protein ParE